MLRLTGGEFRGRILHTPPEQAGKAHIRPTQAKLRQALFNSLQTVIPEANVLDLFGGSGALGFEALSRGARHVTFVEQSPSALKLIDKNAALLQVSDRVTVIADSVAHLMKRASARAPFDLVMADPPYDADWETRLLHDFDWGSLLAEGGVLCLEWGAQKSRPKELPERVPFLVKVREKNYGDSILTTYRKEQQ